MRLQRRRLHRQWLLHLCSAAGAHHEPRLRLKQLPLQRLMLWRWQSHRPALPFQQRPCQSALLSLPRHQQATATIRRCSTSDQSSWRVRPSARPLDILVLQPRRRQPLQVSTESRLCSLRWQPLRMRLQLAEGCLHRAAALPLPLLLQQQARLLRQVLWLLRQLAQRATSATLQPSRRISRLSVPVQRAPAWWQWASSPSPRRRRSSKLRVCLLRRHHLAWAHWVATGPNTHLARSTPLLQAQRRHHLSVRCPQARRCQHIRMHMAA